MSAQEAAPTERPTEAAPGSVVRSSPGSATIPETGSPSELATGSEDATTEATRSESQEEGLATQPSEPAATNTPETNESSKIEGSEAEPEAEPGAEPEAPKEPESASEGEPEDEPEYDEEEVYKLKRHRRARDAGNAPTTGSAPAERRRRPGKASSSKGRDYIEPEEEAQPEEPELDEKTRERRALEAKIDAALQPASKRRKKLAGDDLEMMQDEVIAHLRDSMRDAALKDVESIREGQPAIHKVRMLPEVVKVLQKGSLADSILDGNLLESVRIWLEPLPDASLPSFEIQRELFSALVALPIKTIHLRESGLGRVVLFYQKSRRPHASIKRMAQKLIGDWTRPIIGRSDNYRDKRIATATFDARHDAVRSAGSSGEGPRSSYEESAARRNRAAIPSSSGVSYQVAPVGTVSAGSQQAPSSSGSKDSQLRRMKTKLMASGRSTRKKTQVSVEGKGLN